MPPGCKVRIAFVNAVPFHFEIVGGFLHVLREYQASPGRWHRQQPIPGPAASSRGSAGASRAQRGAVASPAPTTPLSPLPH
jgi:hypothetical protein